MKPAVAIIHLAKAKHLSIGAIESMTGGLLLASLTSVSGASAVVKGGIVTYTNEEKSKLLSISKEKLAKYGAISEPVAHDMAKLGRYRLNVDIALAITGNAGPKAQENKPNGLFYIALATSADCIVHEYHLTGTRHQIRKLAVAKALDLIKTYLENMQ